MQELKPCPFCGGTPVLHVCDGAGLYHVPAKSVKEDVIAGDASYCGRKMSHKMFVCQKCGYRWVAVRPVEASELECPKCGAFEGRAKIHEKEVDDG